MKKRKGKNIRLGTTGLGRAICRKFPFHFLLCLFFLFPGSLCAEELWKISSYCSCVSCCGKSDGITASGKKVRYGIVACNWLKFGTMVKIEGLGVFEVADRGAKSQFGSARNPIKHIDVYLPSHAQALKFGVKYLKVTVLPKWKGERMGKVCRFPGCNTVLSKHNTRSNVCFCHYEILESNNYCYIGKTFRSLSNGSKGGVVWDKVNPMELIGMKPLREQLEVL